MTFVTSSSDLYNATKHKTRNNTANVQGFFTEDTLKYKVNKGKLSIHDAALSAPVFTQNLINVGQLASKHEVVFNKNSCYLRGPTLTPFYNTVIATGGTDNLNRTDDTIIPNNSPWKTVIKKHMFRRLRLSHQ